MLTTLIKTTLFTLFIIGQVSLQSRATEQSQLPLAVQQDLLNADLQKALGEGDNVAIINLVGQLRALNLDLHENLYFFQARALFLTGDALGAYLNLKLYVENAGPEGRYYEQATELLLTVKSEAERLIAIEDEKRRAEKTEREAQARQQALEISTAGISGQGQLPTSAPRQTSLSQNVAEAQKLLMEVGFPFAGTDGKLNQGTREALAIYQVRRNLAVNAEVTVETLQSLRNEVPESDPCDALAGYPRSPGEWRVELENIPPQVAIPACEQAVQKNPTVTRFQIQYGRALLAGGRLSDAISATTDAADKGYAAAELLMGVIYERSEKNGGPRDAMEIAANWYDLAAKQGYPSAQVQLGYFYERGLGEYTRNTATAMQWYQRAADQGYPPAMVIVGDRYTTGEGVRRDYAVALQKLNAAAAAEYPVAYFHLGEMYEYGRGVKRNKPTAISWYSKAADLQHPEAQKKLARLR